MTAARPPRLSPEQRRAAAGASGAVRVVAGPGAGKTAVIAERYRALVAGGVEPSAILVMTFSERAAAEMRQRIGEAVGEDPPAVGTFHALAMRWLREDGAAVGVHSAFTIEAGADRWIALRELMWELGSPELVGADRPDLLVTPLLKVMERMKQELIALDRLEAWCETAEDRERAALLGAATQLFREHERRKRARHRLDFDDLLVSAARLFEQRPAVLDRYRARYPHVMVDEYQDTNLAQERVVELLGGGALSSFVVGDDDQSIYRFRGASLASMERFVRTFPGAQTVSLGRNRRSTARIVEASSALVRNNPERIAKDLVAGPRAGAPVTVLACPDGAAEARAIADHAARLIETGTDPGAVAVLCRTNAATRPIVEAMERRGLPVRLWGAQGLYAVPAVRDVIAMLGLVDRPDDQVALARLLDRLGGGVEAGLKVAREAAPEVSALEAVAAWRPAASWASRLCALRPRALSLGAGDLFFEVMSDTGYLERPGTEAAAVAAVTRLGELVQEFCERSPDQSLRAYLDRLDLVLLSGEDEEVPAPDPALAAVAAVQVMTIHQAKGLEFDAVFVPGMVEGRLPQPHRRDGLDLPQAVIEPAVRGRADHLAEERRLAYVAMTRARRLLFLSWAERYEGSRSWRPSRFLAEAAGSGRVVERAVAAAPEERAPAPRLLARPADGPITLSFSAIAAYRECPRQHWFRYRVSLPAAEGAEAQYGTVVHSVLMRAGAARMRGAAVTSEHLTADLDEEWSRTTLSDPRRERALHALARRQIEAFVAGGGLDVPPLMVERSFTADLGGWRLRGVIDRVDGGAPPADGEDGDPPLRLVDYKTGTPLPASRLRRDLQLALYALGARSSLEAAAGGRPIELQIVYLRDGRRVTIPATEELVEEARQAGEEVARGIAEGRFEPRPERRRCGLCAYRLACSAAL